MTWRFWPLAVLAVAALGIEVARATLTATAPIDLTAALKARGFAPMGEVGVSTGGAVRMLRFRAPGCRSEIAVAALDPSADTVALIREAVGGDAAVLKGGLPGLPWQVARVAVAPPPPDRPDPCALSKAEWAALLH